MASGASLHGKSPVRMLLVGYPGAGKTGAIASLVNAGFKVRLLDFEGNFQPLLEYADEDKLPNVDILTFQDSMRMGQKMIEPAGIPTAFNDALKAMQHWKYVEDGKETDLGKSSEWGPDTVVVVDSLTAMGEASLRRSTAMMNKTPANMTQAVWGAAVADQVNFIKLLTKQKNNFHLIVLGHLQMISAGDFINTGDEDAVKDAKLEAIGNSLIPTKLFPKAVTKNLSQTIHKEFSSMILAERKLKLGATKRVLRTNTGMEVDTKMPAKNASGEYPLETGLATIFGQLGAKPTA